MLVHRLHNATSKFFQGAVPGMVVLLLFMGPIQTTAQETRPAESRLAFFENRAQEDAMYEHDMNWQSEEDEIDFWTDQRNFEKALEKIDYQAYQVYILTKRAAYIDYQNTCEAHQDHGDYYQLQAAFYYQIGSPSLAEDVYIATSASH